MQRLQISYISILFYSILTLLRILFSLFVFVDTIFDVSMLGPSRCQMFILFIDVFIQFMHSGWFILKLVLIKHPIDKSTENLWFIYVIQYSMCYFMVIWFCWETINKLNSCVSSSWMRGDKS